MKIGEDIYLSLLCLCTKTTPTENGLASPAEILYRRKLRSQMLETRQKKQKQHHDKHGVKELPKLSIGQRTTMRDEQSGFWTPVVIKHFREEPRSYLLQTPNSTVLCRNRGQLRELSLPRQIVHFVDNCETVSQPSPKTQNNTYRNQPVQTDKNHTTHKHQNKNTQPHSYKTRRGRTIQPPAKLIEE